MTDKIQSDRVICEGGLDTTENHLNLSINKPGCATRLVNYEVGLSGGYRRVNGYSLYDETYGEVGVGVAEGAVLGIIIFKDTQNGVTKIIAARKDTSGATYSLYLYTDGVGWSAITTGLTRTSTGVDKLRWAVGNDGEKNILCIVDGVNEAILFDGTNWTEIKSGGTGADFANAGGAQAIDAPSVVEFFENHLFLGADTANTKEGVIAHSAPNAFYDWTAGNGAGQITTGIKVSNIKTWRENLFVFAETAIKKVIVESDSFVIKNVTSKIGLLSTDAVVEVGGDLIFLSPDGFRPVSGTDKIGDVNIEIISKPIQKILKDRIVGNAGLNCNMVVLNSKSQFRIFWSTDSLAVDDAQGMIGSLRTADQQTGWEFGELLGFRCNCVTSAYIDGAEIILHGDYDGKVYQQESGNDLNGTDMLSIFQTPYLDFGDTEIRKTLRQIKAFVKGEGSLSFVGELSFDWGDPDVITPSPYEFEVGAQNDMYGDGSEYGDGSVYGGVLYPVAFTNIEGSCFSVRVKLTTYGTEFPHSLHGLVFEYSLAGQR